MLLTTSSLLLALAALTTLVNANGRPIATSTTPFCGLVPGGTINSSQTLQGEAFIGTAAVANPLHPKYEYNPQSFAVHLDGGNTRSLDYPGPLGHNLSVTSSNIRYGKFYWNVKGALFAYYGGPCNGSATNIAFAFAVLNPRTLGIEAAWQAPANASLNIQYGQFLTETDELVVSSQQGQIYVLKVCQNSYGAPTIELSRMIDLSGTGLLRGIPLLNTATDAIGNIWFTTGDVGVSPTAPLANRTIIGYMTADGTINSLEIPNQTIENGFAISNTSVYLVTGPSGEDLHDDAIGTVLALEPSPTGVSVIWNSTYQAGSSRKPGAFARGSGTTPGLLGEDFMAATDNADTGMNLLVFRQNATGENVAPVCTVPLLQSDASWSDNCLIKHWDGKDYSIVVVNMYNEIPFDPTFMGDDSPRNNNLTVQSGGLQKVFINGDGSGCHVEWTNPVRMNTAPVLSTKTGLIYGYEQSEELAAEGQWVWYANAIDFMTGETVWKARTGAGGMFNNYYKTAYLSPDGTFYHPVVGGVVAVRDGGRAEHDRGSWHHGWHEA